MNTDKLNKWLSLIANTGVLVSIIFLALEINQTNQIANAQFLNENLVGRIDAYSARIGNDLPEAWNRAIFNPAEITSRDLIVIDAFLTREWMRAYQSTNLEASGFLQSAFNVRVAEFINQYLGNEISMNWWKAQPKDNSLLALNPEFRDAIDARLELEEERWRSDSQRRLQRMTDAF